MPPFSTDDFTQINPGSYVLVVRKPAPAWRRFLQKKASDVVVVNAAGTQVDTDVYRTPDGQVAIGVSRPFDGDCWIV